MQWKSITSNLSNSVYGLWNNGQKMLTLNYKSKSNKFYLEARDGEKRKFHYQQKGFFKNKTVLQNEYGAELGQIVKEKGQQLLKVDDKNYFIRFKNNYMNDVEIIDELIQQPVATCSIESANSNEITIYNLLMIMCFYIFQGEHYNTSLAF